MRVETQVVHSVVQVGQETWDRLGADRPFASYRWYRYGETVLSGDEPVYIVAWHAGEPVGRATFWLRRRESLPIASGPLRRVVEAILYRRPLLICQTPLAGASGWVLPDPPLREAARTALAQTAVDEARRRRVSFVGSAYLDGAEAHDAGWPADFAAVELPGPGTRLVVRWSDYDGYVRQLSARMRKQIRRHANRATDLGVEIEAHRLDAPPEPATVEQAVALVRQVERRHDTAPNPWARAALEHAALAGGTWLAARIDGRLVACGALLEDGDHRLMTLLGRDEAVRYAYFQLVYAAVRRAIEGGARVVWGGSGAYDTKRRLGFELLADTWISFAGMGRLLQRLGRWVAATEERRAASPSVGEDG